MITSFVFDMNFKAFGHARQFSPSVIFISLNLSESSTANISLLFGSILVGLGLDIDAINEQDDVYMEFVPVLTLVIHSTHAMVGTKDL